MKNVSIRNFENHELTSTMVDYLDKDGKTIKTIYSDDSYQNYEYSNNNMSSIKEYKNEQLVSEILMTYDDKENLIHEKSIYYLAEVNYEVIYEYDRNGNTIKATTLSNDQFNNQEEENVYDSDGRILRSLEKKLYNNSYTLTQYEYK